MTIFIMALLFVLAITILIVLQKKLFPVFHHSKVNKRLLQEGTQAEAVLLNMRQTGLHGNNHSQVKLLMHVHPKTGENYITEIKEVLSPKDLTQLPVGKTLVVKYNPTNIREVIIVKKI